MDAGRRSAYGRLLFFASLVAGALLVGAWYAGSLSFVNDDAFISFRYARHLAEGKGLVYNAGERVEGYTNFLWTMLLSGGIAAGLDPVPSAMTLGILFHLLTIGLCGWFTWRLYAALESNRGAPWWSLLPLAALALAAHRDVNVYATSGLETAMFTFCALLLFVLLVFAASAWSFVRVGIVSAALLLIRPDGIVFVFAALVYVLLLRKNALRRVLLVLAPIALLYLPYWLWRSSYYGFPFPNTYYAKSIDLPNYQNGLAYLWIYFKTYYAISVGLALALILAFGSLVKEWGGRLPRILRNGLDGESYVKRSLVAAALFSGVWMAFVVRIGGDFMFARFLIPATPLLFIALELLVMTLPERGRVLLVVALVAGTLFRFDQYRDTAIVGYIADEWQYYPPDRLGRNKAAGLKLRRYFEGVPLRLAFGGTQAQVVYYADPDLAIEYETGLTDSFVAHQQLNVRGRPGHEKAAPTSYLLARKVNFMLWGGEPVPAEQYISSANFAGVTMSIFVYDTSVMRRFADDPSVQYADVPALLDSMIASFSKYSDRDLLESFNFVTEYYFNFNDDPGRREAMIAELRRRSLR